MWPVLLIFSVTRILFFPGPNPELIEDLLFMACLIWESNWVLCLAASLAINSATTPEKALLYRSFVLGMTLIMINIHFINAF